MPKSRLTPNSDLSLQQKVLIGIAAGGLILSGILLFNQSNSLADWDQDGVADVYDLDDDNDGIPDDIECSGLAFNGSLSVINGSFEGPDIDQPQPPKLNVWGGGVKAVTYLDDDVSGWETSSTDSKIEIWQSGFNSITSYEGEQHAEINATQHAILYQDIQTTPGAIMTWSFAHRGRGSRTVEDSMALLISAVGGTPIEQVRVGTSSADWKLYKGTYTVPAGQTQTRFMYQSISTASGNNTIGNFLDAVRFYSSEVDCPLDPDQDGYANTFDLDSDNDGITDLIEAGGADTNGDGQLDILTDVDGDGLMDIVDNDPTDGPLISGCELGVDCDLSNSTSRLFDRDADGIQDFQGDFDLDGLPNWCDLDSDGDGITDVVEAFGNANNGLVLGASVDSDADGLSDSVDTDLGNDLSWENLPAALIISTADLDMDALPDSGYVTGDTDGDFRPDFLDIDSDGDGVIDNIEAQGTDQYQAPLRSDSDHDGIDDVYDSQNGFGGQGLIPIDSDGDQTPDVRDLDSDDDLIKDAVEAHDSDNSGQPDAGSPANQGEVLSVDQDEDGLDDGYDNLANAKDATNNNQLPAGFPTTSGATAPNWRRYSPESLPVEWLNVDARWEGNVANIMWSTAQEVNNDYFEVQRSTNAKDFDSQIKLQAAGQSQTPRHYEYRDLNANHSKVRLYYRIKQVDFDGAFSFSPIIELSPAALTGRLSLEVYPNPTAGPLTIRIPQGTNAARGGNWKVLSINGQEMMRGSIAENAEALEIDLSSLPAGNYFFSLVHGERVLGTQIQKQ